MSESLKYRVPAFCPLCECVMKGTKSIATYYDFQCCVNCWIEWIDGREEKWKSGWRPTTEQVENFKNKNSLIYR
jgi:hypothetical protein